MQELTSNSHILIQAGTDRRLHYVCKQCPFTMFTVNKEDNQIRRDELLSVVR